MKKTILALLVCFTLSATALFAGDGDLIVNGNLSVGSSIQGQNITGADIQGQKVTSSGVIESTTGGFKFPDGTTQASSVTRTPIVSFYAAKSASQTIGAGPTTISFPNTIHNIGSGYDGNGIFVAPIAGYYQFGLCVGEGAGTVADKCYWIGVVTSTGLNMARVARMAGGANSFTLETPLVHLAVGETARVSTQRISASGNFVTGNEQLMNRFYGYLVRED